MAGNPNFPDDLLSTTWELFMRDQPTDVIFGDLVLWEVLGSRGRTQKDGGIKILEPLMYAKSTALGSYSGYDLLDVSPQEGLTNAEYEWKQYYFTVTISGKEERENQGEPARIIKILDARWQQARMSLQDQLDSDLFGDGSGNGGKALTGLGLAIDSAGTYGNISRSSNTWWSAQEDAVAGALTVAGAHGMRRMYNDCSLGRARQVPNLLITTQILFEAYEALSDSNMRYAVTGDGQVTYSNPNLMFKKAPLFWDDYCQSGVMYFLNTDFMRLVTMGNMQGPQSKGDFGIEPFQKPANQDAKTAKGLWMGQLVLSNAARQGKLTGLTNT